MNKMKDKKKLYDYLINEKNKENILKIFKKEEIMMVLDMLVK